MLGFGQFRPRYSAKRLAFWASSFILFWILLFSLSPITSPLPKYTGPHGVGVLDVEVAVERRVVREGIIRETGERAFQLQTLAITLYYPSTIPPPSPHKKPHSARPWLPQPISLIGTGYARLAGISFPPFQSLFTFALWALGSSTTIPGVVDAPLLSVDQAFPSGSDEETDPWKDEGGELRVRRVLEGEGELPGVVFTHGMAGMSQSYSHYLGSIASHGFVVAAVEHRDGSGPGTIVHYEEGKERRVWHLKLDDLESSPPMTDATLKESQLAFREAEIQETIHFLSRLNAGATFRNLKPDSPQTVLPNFQNRLNMSTVTVAGHSYGATGALQAMKNAPSESAQVNGGIALDPGKGSGPLNEAIDVPVLVIQSGEWTEKQTEFYGQGWHFDVVRKLVEKTRKGWFMTLKGSAHPSCTDAPLIVPWIMKMVTGTSLDSTVALKEYIDISVDFLQYLQSGEKTGLLSQEGTSPQGPLGDTEKRGKVKGSAGADWEVHVVPSL
ncbi:PAF-acetylhydrolase family member [Amniculicola lignicola CBS 123094]|uniref:Putative phospholipase n=1 Tax=Amniculicola lignicola CBS 123094 TaxID=1392246 RepID=A0A6A5WZK9_9PLEO|nr:PAF-acetylhydrolase family member [Amniculicola lignicola CBS 123094]